MKNTTIFTFVLILSAIGHLATDIYLPSMPSMTDYFDTSTTLVQMTFSIYMLSFIVAPLVIGPISDSIGRKKPILIGITLGLVATLLCAFSHNIYVLIFSRFLQGIGLGMVVSLSRALLPDHFQGKELAKYYSYMAMLMPVILAVGPILGGVIQEQSSWRGVFAFMSVYLLIILYIVTTKLQIKENPSPTSSNIRTYLKGYKTLLKNKQFMNYSLFSVFIFSGMSIYLTVSSFLFQELIGLTPTEMGATSLIFFGTTFIVGFMNVHLIKLLKPKQILCFAVPLVLISGFMLISCHYFDVLNIYTLILSLIVFFCSVPLTFANVSALALGSIKSNFGSATALLSCLQFLGGAIASFLISFTNSTSVVPLGATFLMIGFACLMMLFLGSLSENRDTTASSLLKAAD